jgi:hypothetical protein
MSLPVGRCHLASSVLNPAQPPLPEIRQQIFSDILPETFNEAEDEGEIAVVKWTAGSIAPLLLNHQCHYEALYILYSRREFFMFISDVGITIRPQHRNHAWLPTPTHPIPIPLWGSDSGISLISNLSIHVFVKALDEASVAVIRYKIGNLVRNLSGKPLVILRIKMTFSFRASVVGHTYSFPLDPTEIKGRALWLFAAFEGLTAKRVFVELQGHWRGTVMEDWSRKLENLLRDY